MLFRSKLRHLGPDQTVREIVDTHRAPWHPGMVPGLSVMPLMRQGAGSTLVRWAPETRFSTHRHYGGEEIVVVRGVFADEHGKYPAGTWIRSPHMPTHAVQRGRLHDLREDRSLVTGLNAKRLPLSRARTAEAFPSKQYWHVSH